MELDGELDRRLVDALYEDGRVTARALSKRLGVSTRSVSARLRALQAGRMLRVMPVIDIEAAGFQFWVHFSAQIDGRAVREVGDDLDAIDGIVAIALVSGVYDVVFAALAEDKGKLSELVQQVNRVEGIGKLDSTLALDVVKLGSRSSDWSTGREAYAASAPGFDQLDNAIVRRLNENGRASNYEIARHVEVSEGAVRQRIRQMKERRAMKVVGIADWRLFGLRHFAWVGIWVDREYVSEVATALSRREEIVFVATTLGMYDILVGVQVQDREHLMTFLATELRQVAHVRRTECVEPLETVKHTDGLVRFG